MRSLTAVAHSISHSLPIQGLMQPSLYTERKFCH